MCGRFVSTAGPDRIAAYFDTVVPTEPAVESLGENFNVAPTHDVYGVVSNGDGTARVDAFHWGLIPRWAKDRKIASRMINARAETIADKPAFKALFTSTRCIVPMDGFYEWTTTATTAKQPMFIHRVDGGLIGVAALWTRWKDPADERGRYLDSVTLITTGANETMRQVHDRMPVILPPQCWTDWLDPDNDDVDALRSMLVPAADDALAMYPVSTDVNSVRNNRRDLLTPI